MLLFSRCLAAWDKRVGEAASLRRPANASNLTWVKALQLLGSLGDLMQYAVTACLGADFRILNASSEGHVLDIIDDCVLAGFNVTRVTQEDGEEVDIAEILTRAIDRSAPENGRGRPADPAMHFARLVLEAAAEDAKRKARSSSVEPQQSLSPLGFHGGNDDEANACG